MGKRPYSSLLNILTLNSQLLVAYFLVFWMNLEQLLKPFPKYTNMLFLMQGTLKST